MTTSKSGRFVIEHRDHTWSYRPADGTGSKKFHYSPTYATKTGALAAADEEEDFCIAAKRLGRKGGMSKSKQKSAAARRNGRLGGRPKEASGS